MELTGTYTAQGLALLAKVLAGETLAVTRAEAGAGETAEDAVALDQPRQALTLLSPARKENTYTLPVTLAACQAEAAYTLTEVGLYARDPEAGEILLKVYRLDAPVPIAPDSRTVLRFYLSETVSATGGMTAEVSPAGVLLAADFEPVRQTVEATAMGSSVTVTVAATELQAYLDSLPRLLTQSYNITVTGSTEETITASNFYGSGTLNVYGSDDGCTLGGLSVTNCSVYVYVGDIDLQPPAGSQVNCLYVHNSRYVRVRYCCILGNSLTTGIMARYGSRVYVVNCEMTGHKTAVLCESNSIVSVTNNAASAANIKNNTNGAYVWDGGIIMLTGSTPTTLGGSTNVKDGGIITKANGTLL